MKYLLLTVLLTVGCARTSGDCIMLWDNVHPNKEVISFSWADECCNSERMDCKGIIWEENQKRIRKNE